jgi:hypothetical protein
MLGLRVLRYGLFLIEMLKRGKSLKTEDGRPKTEDGRPKTDF